MSDSKRAEDIFGCKKDSPVSVDATINVQHNFLHVFTNEALKDELKRRGCTPPDCCQCDCDDDSEPEWKPIDCNEVSQGDQFTKFYDIHKLLLSYFDDVTEEGRDSEDEDRLFDEIADIVLGKGATDWLDDQDWH